MPTSSKESLKQSRYRNEAAHLSAAAPNNAQAQAEENEPAGICLNIGKKFKLLLEVRFIIVALLIIPLYALAAFVGNDWAYMLPCAMLAALIIGIVLPFLELAGISCTCHVTAKNILSEQEIVLKAWRKPLFGLLSDLVPSGYLNARLHLARKTWSGSSKLQSVVQIPVVLQSLSRGMEMRLPAPLLSRGVYQVESLELATCFPFSLVWWYREIDLNNDKEESDICVLPKLTEIQGNFHSRLTPTNITTGRNKANLYLQHRSSALKGLREFTERDSLNQIHWASSAKAGKFMVREFELESLPDFDVYLDMTYDWSDKQFDLACSAAYALIHYANRLGFTPALRLKPPLDWEPLARLTSDIAPGSAGEELAAEILARLSPLPKDLSDELNLSCESTRSSSSLHLSADLFCSGHRSIVSISPDAGNKLQKTQIVLYELQANSDPAHSTSSSQIGNLESETELARL